jgi:hypothetical protein
MRAGYALSGSRCIAEASQHATVFFDQAASDHQVTVFAR